jgi:DNA repair exonuclease SbcCD ATPase subunit
VDQLNKEVEQQQEEIRDRNNQIMDLQASLQEAQQQAITSSKDVQEVREKLKEKKQEAAQLQLQGGGGGGGGPGMVSQEVLAKMKTLETQLVQISAMVKTRELELDAER